MQVNLLAAGQPSALTTWFAQWVQRRAEKNRRFKVPGHLLRENESRSHPTMRDTDRDLSHALADVPEHLRSDLGLDGGARLRPSSEQSVSMWELGGSMVYYDRIIGAADRR